MLYTTSPEEFDFKCWDQRYDVLDIRHISDHVDRVVRRLRPELCKAPRTNNLVIASYVTSHARLRLYHFIEQVESDPSHCRLLYTDTDSIMYAKKAGATGGICEGDQLGEMKREYAGRRIVEFVSGGPKNYAYRHQNAADGQDEKVERKIRGFELNFQASEQLDFGTIKRMAFDTFSIDGSM